MSCGAADAFGQPVVAVVLQGARRVQAIAARPIGQPIELPRSQREPLGQFRGSHQGRDLPGPRIAGCGEHLGGNPERNPPSQLLPVPVFPEGRVAQKELSHLTPGGATRDRKGSDQTLDQIMGPGCFASRPSRSSQDGRHTLAQRMFVPGTLGEVDGKLSGGSFRRVHGSRCPAKRRQSFQPVWYDMSHCARSARPLMCRHDRSKC